MENDKNKYPETTGGSSQDTGQGGWDVSVSSSVKGEPAEKVPEEPVRDNMAAADTEAIIPQDKICYPVWVTMLCIIAVFYISQFIAYYFVIPRGAEAASKASSTLIAYLINFSVTITFAWWICRRHGNLPARPLKFSLKKTNPTLILWGLVLVMITSVVVEPLLELFPREYLEGMANSVGRGGWAMVTAIIAAPLLEEILCRGIIQTELVSGFGRIKGIIMAAAIFGLMHPYPQQMINAFFIGIILGYLFIRSGSLVLPVLIHAINNAIAFIMMQFMSGNFIYTRDLFKNEKLFWIIYAVCCVIFVFAGWNLMRELKKLDRTSPRPAA